MARRIWEALSFDRLLRELPPPDLALWQLAVPQPDVAEAQALPTDS